MNNETNTITKGNAKVGKTSNIFTTDEKAQYEVFKNGKLPKDTIEKWIRNDLGAIMSFVHGCLKDERIFSALVNAYYERYQALHETQPTREEIVNEMENRANHEPKRTTTN